MQTIEASYDIVTPMFIGGGDISALPELRPPSIKGALRFWWRAMQWGDCLKDNETIEAALIKLHQREADLFGAAVKENRYGQSKVSLKIKLDNGKQLAVLKGNSILPNRTPGQIYLLGQGLYDLQAGFSTAAIAQNQIFSIIIKLHNDVDVKNIINSLLIFGLLGGLGSRSRRGWGSVSVRSIIHKDKTQQIKNIPIPNDMSSYKQAIGELLKNVPDRLPPFSAFSKQTRIDISTSGDQAMLLLSQVGNEMQLYRSYGREMAGVYQVNGKPAEQNFGSDHDCVQDFARNGTIQEHPKRVIFGLPHNYFFSHSKYKVDIQAIEMSSSNTSLKKKKEQLHRRASPLFIHIHKFESGQCIAVQSLLKADFLPDTDRIYMANKTKDKNKGKTVKLPCVIDWCDITNYLDRFKQRECIL
jgi:CRISPR-associated protein Cmr1